MPRGSRLAKPSQQQLSPTLCSTVATQNHKHALSSLEAAAITIVTTAVVWL